MMKGWTVTEFYIEAGVSGSVPLADRPEGHRLLAAAGKGDIIITAKLDRAFRSAAAEIDHVQRDALILELLQYSQRISDVTGNGISKMVFTILAAVATDRLPCAARRLRETQGRSDHQDGA
jgi:putative DNA-invertase from lambdoid prophage Rac